MRKDPHNPAKACGYILVPLYLELTTCESIEDAVNKADFGEVWNVLQALQEQDEVLADIIRQIQQNQGNGGEQNYEDFSDIIDICGVDISLKSLQESISAVCVDKLGCTWDIRYGELIKYKERFGDCNVPTKWTDNIHLGSWVSTQRQNYYSKRLNDERFKCLENIGFIWDKLEYEWQEMFNTLKKFKENYGHCNVPQNWSETPRLADWIHKQRFRYSDERISANQSKRLKQLGFVFDLHELYWEEMFDTLNKYKEEHGNCNVPFEYRTKTNKTLGRWVNRQRINKGTRLSAYHIKSLNKIGFEWEDYGF